MLFDEAGWQDHSAVAAMTKAGYLFIFDPRHRQAALRRQGSAGAAKRYARREDLAHPADARDPCRPWPAELHRRHRHRDPDAGTGSRLPNLIADREDQRPVAFADPGGHAECALPGSRRPEWGGGSDPKGYFIVNPGIGSDRGAGEKPRWWASAYGPDSFFINPDEKKRLCPATSRSGQVSMR
jgi:hypothetical protein